MAAMGFDQIMSDLKKKIYHPVYFLQGEEPYFIDKVSDYIERNLLSDGEKGFNQTLVYGKDTEWMTLLDILRRYPMMSNHQVVILKEAQDFKGLDKLEPYFKNPMKSTIFVVCHKYKTIRKGTNFQKLVEKESAFFNSVKFYDNQLPSFVDGMVRDAGFKMEPNALHLLVENLGNDLGKIEMELKKLEINVPKTQPVTVADIDKYIGISKEYNSFELVNAIASRNAPKAFRIADHFIRNPKDNPTPLIIAALFTFYSKAYTYMALNLKAEKNDYDLMKRMGVYKNQVIDLRAFGNNYNLEHAEKSIEILQEYDLKFKGVNAPNSAKEELITEMVFRLMN